MTYATFAQARDAAEQRAYSTLNGEKLMGADEPTEQAFMVCMDSQGGFATFPYPWPLVGGAGLIGWYALEQHPELNDGHTAVWHWGTELIENVT
jgi:hypothetical protein|tara:strand:+ start:2109 stop:2390 length:282 start_codon:yes stop_codon:yes gene_type:complete